jgi:phosphoribosylformylglycinamidine cyclo-ligase
MDVRVKSGAYAKAGVNVDIEAEASRIMYEASRQTFELRKGKIGDVITPFDDFSGLRAINIGKLPEGSVASLCFDGVGTKSEIAERVGRYDTIAFDVFAMVCDDAVVRGGEPLLIGTNLDLKTLGNDERFLPIVRELASGYVSAAAEANVAIVNGEIAQMGSLMGGYGDFPFHWGAALLWVGRKEQLLTGREIRAGDAVVLLREHGFRTNGLSLVRKVFESHYGKEWHLTAFEEGSLGEAVLTPSKIYTKILIEAHGGFDSEGSVEIHGVSHITGGGIPEKLGRALKPSGLGVHLDNLFDPPPVTKECQRLGSISDQDAYGTWNMGQGMAVFTPEPEKLITIAESHGVEAKQGGVVTSEPEISLSSRGTEQPGVELLFPTHTK